ncbi:MAG: NTP transferase domain-containing protein [Calditrichae bacterium]|nr:NTP transferase domain-containing protein [Calditrichota bacterium]MCB9059749.1 NTP transferase domain-containing protein [Calditrichia bacterium]
MKAMIFAAGMGTRLRPLTNSTPKALIKINDRPLLEWIILRLKSFGYKQLIINVYHHAESIVNFLDSKKNFGLHIEISREDILADTGGGLKKAAWFFEDVDHFLIHNVDILTDIDLNEMLSQHVQRNADATLAIRKRQTSRYLLFNSELMMCGWRSKIDNQTIWSTEEVANAQEYAFSGIHIFSTDLLKKLKNDVVFSIIPEYLRLAANHSICGYFTESDNWIDLGRKENLESVNLLFDKAYFDKLSY